MLITEILTRSDIMGGVQSHVRDLSVALRARGHQVIVLMGGEGIFFRQMQALGLNCYSIPHLVHPVHLYYDFRALAEIATALRKHKPDIVCTHSAKAGWLGRGAARMCGIPSVFTPHGWSMVDRGSLRGKNHFRLAEKIAGAFTTKIINVCEYERDLALRNRITSPDKLEVVANGIPDIVPEQHANVTFDPPTLVMIARYEKQKDHHTLLHALARIRDLPWKLTLVGDGGREMATRQTAIDLSLSDRVEFLPSTSDIPHILSSSQMFVLTTNFEALPISILEAMRAGLPVVATDVGGVNEIVTPEGSGILVPRGDVQAVSAALRRLIAAPELREKMGRAGRSLYKSHFGVQTMVTRTLGVYAEAMRSFDAAIDCSTAGTRQQ